MKRKIAVLLLNLLSKTWRITMTGNTRDFDKGLVVFWHGFMLPVWKFFANKQPAAVVSLSKDGEILSRLLSLWGYKLIRGSSSSRGKEVLDEIIKNTYEKIVLMTPDGPRGPRYEMKAGAVVAASRSEVPIFLCGVNIRNKYIFEKSWDKFCLPLPFSKVEIILSEPYFIENTRDKNIIDIKISELQTKLLLLYSDKL